MKNYFYHDGSSKQGPFTLDELKEKGLKRDTPVWCHPMPDWKPAGELPELADLFGQMPPEIKKEYTGTPTPPPPPVPKEPMPKTWLVESILATLFCCLPFGIVGIVYSVKVDSAYRAGDYDAARKASREAGTWTKVSFFIGLGGVIIYFILIAAGVATSIFAAF